MFINLKIKAVRLIVVACSLLLLLFLCLLFFLKKPFLGQKMTMNYVTNSNFEIKNCKRDLGSLQKLIGTYDNVAYCLHFPIFENRKWNNVVFNEINDRIYSYKKSRLSANLVNDKFECFSNYQTFKFGENDDNVAIQMQFYEKNLTKKKNVEFIKTFLFIGDDLINEKKFFNREGYKKIINEIRNVFIAKYPKYKNTDLSNILPYNLKTLHNFVLTNSSVVFFYERGRVLPERNKIVSIEVDKSKIIDYINYGNKKSSDVEKQKPRVALTFDDGPDGEKTGELLEILKQNGAKATFFVVGKQIKENPELLKKMVDYDCEIGNHTFSHSNLNRLNENKINDEINKTSKAIEQATGGYRPSLIRPPFGACNKKVLNMINLPVILWSIDTLDWKHKNSAKTIETVLTQVNDGSIILMHDIHKESIEAAKVIIPELIKKGYELVTISELADVKGESLSPHNKYSRIKNVL